MRKYLVVMMVSFSLLSWAGNKIVFHLKSGVSEKLDLSEKDTVHFNESKITLGSIGKSYEAGEVDSLTFELATPTEEEVSGDTVFITYNDNSVFIKNPFADSLLNVSTDGAAVNIISTANKKGIVYYLSGTSSQGSFNFTPDRGYTLVMDNLSLVNETSPIILNESADGTSFVANLHLRGTSFLEDGTTNTQKGAISTKSKLKISIDEGAENGSLNIKGKTQHALKSSKRIELYNGTLEITEAMGDGINADGVEMYGGTINIAATGRDGIDCSEVVRIEAGKVNILSTADDVKGIKCDSIIEISGGDITIEVNGAGSKALKSKQNTIFSGGLLTAYLNAENAFIENEDYSYNAAIKSDQNIEIKENAQLIVNGDGISARALNSDWNTYIQGGEINIDLAGLYNIEATDTTSVYGIKADSSVIISGGNSIITIGNDAKTSKGIKANNVTIKGGVLNITNDGNYFSLSNNTFATAKAIKADSNVNILGGESSLTCNYGKGITCDGNIVIGTIGDDNGNLLLSINAGCTACGTYTSSSSSSNNPWGGMGGGMSSSRTKYNGKPKGISVDGIANINSGTLKIKAFDTGVLAPEINVNGGDIEIDAAYDQALFGTTSLTFNGGHVYVPASYEAFSGATITFNEGSSTYAISSDDAWNATNGSSTNSNGSTVYIYVKGGNHYAQASGDGLDSNGSMSVSGGIIVCSQTGGGNAPIDTNNGWTHTGGFVLSTGSKDMFSESIPSSSAGHIYNQSMNISANQYLLVANNSGKVLAAFKVPQTATAAVCAHSDAKQYQFYVGNSYDGEMEYFNGSFGLYTTDQPSISTGNYTSYTASTGSSSGGRW
jgi:hypothetical protein